MNNRRVELFAHRGGRSWGPENTMCVFKKSLELGVDGVELDVQRLKSGELVVFHDENLNRTTNGAGAIYDCTLDELERLSAGSWYGEEFHSEKVPLLKDVLKLVDGQVKINIEVKNLPYRYEGIEDELIEVMDQYRAIEKIIFSSFDHGVIARMSLKRPDWNYAVLMVGVPHDLGAYAKGLKAKYFNPQMKSFHKDACEEARKAGIAIYPWTVNDLKDLARMLEFEVTGIITDNPKEIKDELLGLFAPA